MVSIPAGALPRPAIARFILIGDRDGRFSSFLFPEDPKHEGMELFGRPKPKPLAGSHVLDPSAQAIGGGRLVVAEHDEERPVRWEVHLRSYAVISKPTKSFVIGLSCECEVCLR